MWKGSILDSSQTYDMLTYIYISYFYRKIGEVLFVSFLFDHIVERFHQNDLINRQPSWPWIAIMDLSHLSSMLGPWQPVSLYPRRTNFSPLLEVIKLWKVV